MRSLTLKFHHNGIRKPLDYPTLKASKKDLAIWSSRSEIVKLALAKKRTTYSCGVCRKLFEAIRPSRCCSDQCRQFFRRYGMSRPELDQIKTQCAYCGSEFRGRGRGKTKKRFCSLQCSGTFRSKSDNLSFAAQECSYCAKVFTPVRKTQKYCKNCKDPRRARRHRAKEITGIFNNELDFQEAISHVLLAELKNVNREVLINDGHTKVDIVAAGVPIECKIESSAGSIYRAIGQLVHYRAVFGVTPILLIPSDCSVAYGLESIISAIPAKIANETNILEKIKECQMK